MQYKHPPPPHGKETYGKHCLGVLGGGGVCTAWLCFVVYVCFPITNASDPTHTPPTTTKCTL